MPGATSDKSGGVNNPVISTASNPIEMDEITVTAARKVTTTSFIIIVVIILMVSFIIYKFKK